ANDVDEMLLSGEHVTRPRRIEINAFASRIPASYDEEARDGYRPQHSNELLSLGGRRHYRESRPSLRYRAVVICDKWAVALGWSETIVEKLFVHIDRACCIKAHREKRADAEDAKVSTSDCSTISYTDFLLTESKEVEEILGDPTLHSLPKSEDDFLHNSSSDVNLDFKWNDPLTHQ
ncbi:hypothetical protein ALC57_14464, partial [Trachymyrmex cornetzi]